MVADKFPNGLNGPIGLNPNGPIFLIFPIFPINSTSISTTKFVVRRVPSATLGKNATDG